MSKVYPSHPAIHQLPFLFHQYETCRFDNFYQKPNEIVVAALKQLVKQPGFSHSVYLWGWPGVGCSHLLKACVESKKQLGSTAVYLSLADVLTDYHPSDFADVVQLPEMLCLDDIDSIAAKPEWEHALFKLYNSLMAQKVPMVFAAHRVPHSLNFRLPDLASRLNSGLIFKVHPLNDAQKIAALQLRAHFRGCELPKPVAEFLLSRLQRNASVLLDALNQLDLFALAQKRKLTLPFVKSVLKL